MAIATSARGGRKPKGRRTQISAKVPVEYKPLFEEAASKAGMPLCDYVAVVLAEAHGLPEPDYIRAEMQDPLPIGA